jgi:peptide/nickel transport system permease protein
MIPVLIGITLLIFFILSLSKNDPAVQALSTDYTQEEYAYMREQMGLNDPFVVRYVNYLTGVLKGDFGEAWFSNYDVGAELARRLPYTIGVGLYANLISIVLGIPLGIISGVRQNKLTDYIITFLALILASAPAFWIGMMAQTYIGVKWQLLPVSGVGSIAHFHMPAFILGASMTATNIRITRTWLIDVIRSDYVRTARAKGARELTVIVKHALRNALIPVITVLGSHFGMILGATSVVEILFGIPGSASFMTTGVRVGDVPIVMGFVVFVAVFLSAMNLLIDLLYAVVDPRIRYS